MTNIDKAQKWYARRNAVSARTDEDAAMASMTKGPFATRGEAREALTEMISREIAGWRRMNMDPARDERALVRVEAGEDVVIEGGVRWQVDEITGNPAPKPIKVRKPAPLSATMSLVLTAVAIGDEDTIHAAKTGTWAALVTRGLVTPATRPTEHKLTEAGLAVAAAARAQAAAVAKYKAGDRLHFRPTPERAPFGTAIAESDVEIVEVVDHGSATPHSPRFTYVVRALDGGGTQGTDDRELTEIEPMEEIEIPAITVAQRIDHFIKADQIATEIGRKIGDDRRLNLGDVWDFSPNVDRAKLLRELAAELTAYAVAMDAAAGFEALSRTPAECRNCAEPISLRFAEATSSDWKHIKTNERWCGYHFGTSATARPKHC